MRTSRRPVLIVLLVLGFCEPPCHPAEFGRPSLAGLAGVGVSVTELSPEAARDGLSIIDVRTYVELRLRMAGIRVLTDEEVRSTPGQPLFHVIIFLYKSTVDPKEVAPFYAKGITAHLYQSVRLARTSSTAVHRAITWESSLVVGIQPADGLKADIRADVNDRVDEFINAYLAVNQPKSASGNPAR